MTDSLESKIREVIDGEVGVRELQLNGEYSVDLTTDNAKIPAVVDEVTGQIMALIQSERPKMKQIGWIHYRNGTEFKPHSAMMVLEERTENDLVDSISVFIEVDPNEGVTE